MDAGHGRPRVFDLAAVAALLAGALAQLLAPALLPRELAWALLALASVGLAAIALPRPLRRHGGPLPGWPATFLVGMALCALHGQHALDRRLPPELDGAVRVLEGTVVGLPEWQGRGARFHFDVDGVADRATEVGTPWAGQRLDVRWYGGGQALAPGERWRLVLRLATVRAPLHPGVHDGARAALLDGTSGRATVVAGTLPLRLGAARGLDAFRDRIAGHASDALGADRARFVVALAVGDTRGLTDADWERLRRFGLTHLIAISGFHVGMVAAAGAMLVMAIWWLFPSLCLRWRRSQAAALGACAVAVGYAGLAGFSLPTVRTVLMVAVAALVVACRRRVDASRALLSAVAIIVVVDPLALLSPGFWLSCGGVAWLLWSVPGATRAWDIAAFLRAQWVATLGLMPFAAAFFLQVPVLGPLANLVAIPWISLVVVPLALVGVVLLPLSELAASVAWQWAASAMGLLWQGLGQVPPAITAVHWLPAPSNASLVLALCGIAWALLPRGVPGRAWALCLVLPMLFPPRDPIDAGDVEITVLALPRGDAVLLRTARHAILVDAGPAGVDLVRRLRAIGVTRIDLHIETRANAGRIGGASALDAGLPPRQRWASPGATASACAEGRRWEADGVAIVALAPHPEGGPSGPDGACVLRVEAAGGHHVWLVSDAGPWVARRLAAAGGASTRAWVVGAPAPLPAWQAALQADVAVASRAPGPSLDRRWPEGVYRVDDAGTLRWRVLAPMAADGRWRPPHPIREVHRRWWWP